jgi:hypothetical protein
MVNAALHQVGFRARNDDGNESGASWKAAENTGWVQVAGEVFRFRLVVQEVNGANATGTDFQLSVNRNSGGWFLVTPSTSIVRAVGSSNVTDGEATTNQLASGTGDFTSGEVSENGQTGGITVQGSRYTEVEFVVEIVEADVSENDTIEFRVTRPTNGTLDAYPEIGVATVELPAPPPPPAPELVSGATNEAGTEVRLTFSENMADPTGEHGAFEFTRNGGSAEGFSGAALASGDPTTIVLTISGGAVEYGDTLLVSYTPGTVESSDGGSLASFTDQAVTNQVPEPPPEPITALSNILEVQTAPAMPLSVSVLSKDHESVQIGWSDQTSGAFPHRIRRRVGAGEWVYSVEAAGGSTHTMEPLDPEVTYEIQVAAYNPTSAQGGEIESRYTASIFSTTDADPDGPENLGNWGVRFPITTDPTLIDEVVDDLFFDLSDAPAAFWDQVRADGGDIRVTTSDGETQVAREVVGIDAVGNTGALFFRAVGLSSTVATTYYVFAGNASAVEPEPDADNGRENVWVASYVGVWHLAEDPNTDPDGYLDSSGTGNHGTGYSRLQASVPGPLGFPASKFDNTVADGVVVPYSASTAIPGSMTVRGWGILTNHNNRTMFVRSNAGVLAEQQTLLHVTSTNVRGARQRNITNHVCLAPSFSVDTWAHMGFTHNGGVGTQAISSGVAGSLLGWTGSATTLGEDFASFIGNRGSSTGVVVADTNRGWNGSIQEVRLENVHRSMDYLKTEYNNQADAGLFFDVGEAELQFQEVDLVGAVGAWGGQGVSPSLGAIAVSLVGAGGGWAGQGVTDTVGPVARSLGTGLGAWQGSPVNRVTGPVSRDLTPSGGGWSGSPVTRDAGVVARALAPGGGSWEGMGVSRAVGAVLRSLEAAGGAWGAQGMTVTPGPVNRLLDPGAGVWTAGQLTRDLGALVRSLAPGGATWAGIGVVPEAGVDLVLVPAVGGWAGSALDPTAGGVVNSLVAVGGTWEGGELTSLPGPVTRDLVAVGAPWSAESLTPLRGPVNRAVSPGGGTWSALGAMPAPGEVLRSLVAAPGVWSAQGVTRMMGGLSMAVGPAGGTWEGRGIQIEGGDLTLPLNGAGGTWQGGSVQPDPGGINLPLVGVAGAWGGSVLNLVPGALTAALGYAGGAWEGRGIQIEGGAFAVGLNSALGGWQGGSVELDPGAVVRAIAGVSGAWSGSGVVLVPGDLARVLGAAVAEFEASPATVLTGAVLRSTGAAAGTWVVSPLDLVADTVTVVLGPGTGVWNSGALARLTSGVVRDLGVVEGVWSGGAVVTMELVVPVHLSVVVAFRDGEVVTFARPTGSVVVFARSVDVTAKGG